MANCQKHVGLDKWIYQIINAHLKPAVKENREYEEERRGVERLKH